MIVFENGSFITNSDYPDSDWYPEDDEQIRYVVPDGSPLAEKILNTKHFELVVEDGELVDITPLPDPEPIPEPPSEIEILKQEKEVLAESIYHLTLIIEMILSGEVVT